MSDVKLTVSSDGSELRKDIDSDIKALQAFARVVDVTNKTAVSAFRESAAAQREQMDAVGATAAQYASLDQAVKKVEGGVAKMDATNNRLQPGLKTGARGMDRLAFAMQGASLSAQGATFAVGNLAQGIASSSKNAALAASASGIGALTIALGVLVGVSIEAYQKLTAIPKGVVNDFTTKHIANLKTVKAVDTEIAHARQQNAVAIEKLTRGDQDGVQAVANTSSKITALQERRLEIQKELLQTQLKEAALGVEGAHSAEERYRAQLRLIDLQRAEAVRSGINPRVAGRVASEAVDNLDKAAEDKLFALHTETGATTGGFSGVEEQKRRAVNAQAQTELRALDDMTLKEGRRAQLVDAINAKRDAGLKALRLEIALTQQANEIQLGLASDDFTERHEAKLKQIAAEEEALIKSGVSVNEAYKRGDQLRRDLARDEHAEELAAIKSIEAATVNSKNREVRAIGLAAQVARRVDLGYKGVSETVESIAAAGKALTYAAAGQFASAGLAGASSLEHAAAAALAFSESGGGGGGGRSASAGGGGGGGQSPRESTRLGTANAANDSTLKMEIVIVRKDADGKETSRQRQRIQRLEDRNQPIRMSV